MPRSVASGAASRRNSPDDRSAAGEIAALTDGRRQSHVRNQYLCSLCSRTGFHANPCSRRHAGRYLKFAHKAQCLSCRNFLNGHKGQLKEKPKQDDVEKAFDEVTVQSIEGHHITPAIIVAVEARSHESKKLLDIFLDREKVLTLTIK